MQLDGERRRHSKQSRFDKMKSSQSRSLAAVSPPTLPDPKRRSYVCMVCGLAFSRRIRLSEHAWTHTGKKAYQCDECDASYTQRHNLNRHALTHKNKRVYKCTVCRKTVPSRYLDKLAKCGRRCVKCIECSQPSSPSPRRRDKREVRSPPTPPVPMDVRLSPEVTIEPTTERIEVEMPTGLEVTMDIGSCLLVQLLEVEDSSNEDDGGGDDYRIRANLLGHINGAGSGGIVPEPDLVTISCVPGPEPNATLPSITAEEDDKQSGEQSDDDDCENDLQLVLEEEEVVSEPVKVSNAPPTSRRNRATNVRKPYRCNVCSLTFSRYKRLTEHAWTHTGKKAYQCTQCPASYTQRHNLTRHTLSHGAAPPITTATTKLPATKKVAPRSSSSTATAKCTVCGVPVIPRHGSRMNRNGGRKRYKCELCKRNKVKRRTESKRRTDHP